MWSCGGGKQSAAIGALIVSGKLEKPDLALIVDTGREKSTTWQYYDTVLKPALASIGVDIVRVHKDKYATVDIYAENEDGTFCFPFLQNQASFRPIVRMSGNSVLLAGGFANKALPSVRTGLECPATNWGAFGNRGCCGWLIAIR